MALTTISGAGTTASPVSNELVIDMKKSIQMLDPDTAPFVVMLENLGVEKAQSFKVEWLEDQLFPRLTSLSVSAASGDTFLTVPTGEGLYINSGDLVRVGTTGECVRATAAGQSTGFSVTRALGTVAAASAASGGDLVILGNTSAQGATLPTILMLQRVWNYNYTTIQRNSYGWARTALQTATYGPGSLMDKERIKKLVEHRRAIEQQAFRGPRYYNSTGPVHAAGGLTEFVTTNVHDAGGTFSKSSMQTNLRTDFGHGSQNKVLFAAPIISQVLSAYLQDNWIRATPDDKVWGVQVSGVISGAYGSDLPVKTHRYWNDFSTSSSQYGGWAFFVDLDNIQYCPLQTTIQLRNRQAPDYDGVKEEYLTEFSFRIEQDKTHAIWKNITG